MSEITEAQLTPTEGLCMEVLSARYRLGEKLWTMDSKNMKALKKLETYGLVNLMHGMVEHTVRASLTEAGKKMYLTEDYVPPVFREFEEKLKRAKKKSAQKYNW